MAVRWLQMMEVGQGSNSSGHGSAGARCLSKTGWDVCVHARDVKQAKLPPSSAARTTALSADLALLRPY
ncbi:hypothetical protein NL676_022239 [Syzygium grande]|nr:hypothetical protein NL676_022239 [Syzygium grande]